MSLTKIDLGFSVAGSKGKEQGYVHITRNDVVQRIKKHPSIDSWTKEYLCKRINDFPDSALTFFVQNINQIVTSAINERSRLIKERNNETGKKIANEIGQSESQQSGGGEGDFGVVQVASEKSDVKEETGEKERDSFFSGAPGPNYP